MPHELVAKLSTLIEESGPELKVRLGILQILVAAWEMNADVNLSIITDKAQLKHSRHEECHSGSEDASDDDVVEMESDNVGTAQGIGAVFNEIDFQTHVTGSVKQSAPMAGNVASEANVSKEVSATSTVGELTERIFVCTVCRKVYKSQRYLAMHMLAHKVEAATPTKGNTPKSLKCDLCSKIFTNETQLSNHLRTHKQRSKIQYECNVCHEVLNTKMRLKEHMATHTQEAKTKEILTRKVSQCGHCEKICLSVAQLKTHMALHFDATSRRCLVCQKTFNTMHSLKLHMFLHTRGGPYECLQCGQPCRSSKCLKVHMQVHTGAMPFQCSHCGQAFRTKGSVMAHTKRRHAQQ